MNRTVVHPIIVTILAGMTLSACVTLPTGPSLPMSPEEGKPFNVYLAEDRTCRQIAEQQLGKYYEYLSTDEAQYQYDTVFVNCMLSHGNRILGPVR